MNKFSSPIFLLLLILSMKGISQQRNIISGNIIAMLHSNDEAQLLVASLQKVDRKFTQFKQERILSKSMHIFLFDFDATAIDENKMLNAAKSNPLVLIAQFNHQIQDRTNTPNDANFSSMWDMNNNGGSGGIVDADIDAPEAWDITTGGLTASGDTIVVAVIDGGFKLTHPDLNFWKNNLEIPGNGIDDDNNGYIDDYNGWNVATSSDAITGSAHGTHVSGTIGARGNNSIGVTGVNWNVKVMPIMYGSAGEADVVVAYSYVMDNRRLYNQTNGAKGAFVVSTNSSFGVDLAQPSAYPLWCAMYDSLGSVGVLSACATANANYNIDLQGDIPTACASDWMIAVTNTTNSDSKNNSCGYGATTIDLGAPGTNITSTSYSGTSNYTYVTMTGTSMATPHVAGAVALMYSVQCNRFITDCKANPAAMALMVKDSLLGAVDLIASMGSGATLTGGRLNLFKSVKAVQNYCAAVSINIPEQNEMEQPFELKAVYPNPANNILSIVYNSFEPVELILVNVLGEEVKRIKGDTSTKGIKHSYVDTNAMAKGIYFLSIHANSKVSKQMKVVIN